MWNVISYLDVINVCWFFDFLPFALVLAQAFHFHPHFFNILFDLLLVADVKAKINSLRTYFSRELAKESTTSRKSVSGRDEVFKSKWPCLESLEFLRDSIAPRKATSSLVNYILQKQLFADVLQNRCSWKFRKFHRKTPVLESLFNEVAGLDLQLY